MGKVKNWLWGLVLIAVGVIWGINALGIAQINIFFPGWWTLFIIVPCVIDLFEWNTDKTGDFIGIAIGVCLMLGCLGVFRIGMVWKLMLPAILVIIGLSLIFKDMIKAQVLKGAKKLNKSENKEYMATFSGLKVNFAGEKFEGAKMDATFGGIQCDLREAEIKEGALIKACSVFGGITIRVPKDIEVKMVSTSLFGGATDRYREKSSGDKKKTLYIDATCIFGGVEVK